jgi:hypothetical protein
MSPNLTPFPFPGFEIFLTTPSGKVEGLLENNLLKDKERPLEDGENADVDLTTSRAARQAR